MGNLTNRDIILQAAKEEFLSYGYDATRMRSIADRAKLNKGLLHYYFKSKEALLIEVFQGTFKELFDCLDRIFSSDIPVREIVELAINEYIDFISSRPRLPYFIFSEFHRDPQRRRKQLEKAKVRPPFHLLARAIEEGKANGTVSKDIQPKQFIINMVSLVIFPVIGKPMIKFSQGLDDMEFDALMEERKIEITKLLTTALEPKT